LDLFSEESIFQDEDSPRYRVIQVNLAGSNLDRCGIVWSISRPLTAHMNLLYLSTFKSANVLVIFFFLSTFSNYSLGLGR
jgi:hypothetical protein